MWFFFACGGKSAWQTAQRHRAGVRLVELGEDGRIHPGVMATVLVAAPI